MKIFRIIIITTLFIQYSLCCKANSLDISFHTLSPSGGFYYDGILDLLHDDVGYIWIVMPNEIFRFDGQRHKRYSSKFYYQDTAEPICFSAIEKDDQGRIYVATTKGIFVYDRELDVFGSLLPGCWTGVKKDLDGKLWFYNDLLVGFWEEERGIFTEVAASFGGFTEKRFHANEAGVLIGTKKGEIYSIASDAHEVELYFKFPEDYSISGIASNDSTVWVLTENQGLFVIDSQSKVIVKKYTFFAAQKAELIPAKVLYLKDEYAWVGTLRGLHVINMQDDSHVTYLKHNNSGLPSSSIWTIYEDERHNLLIGTYAGGLCYVDFKGGDRFQSYFYDTTELINNLVSCFAEDDEYLWIGTEGGGVNRLNKKTGELKSYTHMFNRPSLSFDNVKSLAFDAAGRLWIGMYRAGLDCFDVQKGTFHNFRLDQQSDVKKIVLEADSGLWCANQSNQYVSFVSFKSGCISHYRVLDQGIVADICRGGGDDLWVAKANALYRVDVSTMNVKSCVSAQENMRIETIAVDGEGIVWIGTMDSGVLKYNPRDGSLCQYDEILKYGVYIVYSICFDDAGNPWFGTDNGLFKLDKNHGETFYRFDGNDGIRGMTFYPKSCMKGRGGELYFGGMNGFTVVYPSNVHVDGFKPQVVISDFYVNNRLVTLNEDGSPLTKNIEVLDEVFLDHKQDNFGFRFFSNDYINSSKSRFKYRLKGYDRDWIEVDATHNMVNYVKVPSGNYVFEVIAANSDGLWNVEPTCVRIKMLPSPFRTWWAYCCYFLLLLSVACIIAHYYLRQKKMELKLYMEDIKTQQREAAHQSQLRFFTNISHEFRTPLFLMIAALDRLEKGRGEDKYFQLLTRNTHRLLTLINELLDFRTIENEQMKLNLAKGDINVLVDAIARDFQFYASDQGISFSICKGASLDGVLIYFDPQIIEKIVLNLLNNAFKFTTKGGTISIETYGKVSEFKPSYANSHKEGREVSADDFCIVVRDTGVGISKDSIADIFVRFFKIKEEGTERHMGSGIGLALVKGLVLLHKGSIVVYSERGKGTEFVVSFSRNELIYEGKGFGKHGSERNAIVESNVDFPECLDFRETEHQESCPIKQERKCVLLVEDNVEVRMTICEFIAEYFEVLEAADGVEALEMLSAKKNIDLVISDVMMPRKDGVALCQEVKADINFSHIPFVMLTAKGGVESRIEGVDAGADAYFEKPVNLKLLLVTIRNLLSQKQKMKDYWAKNYFVENMQQAISQQDNIFMEKLIEVIEANIERSDIDVNYVASQLSMSRSKLYNKIRLMTGKSIVEFIRSYRLRKAARLLSEENLSIKEVMMRVGIESDSYFAKSFKAKYGVTPSEFMKKLKNK